MFAVREVCEWVGGGPVGAKCVPRARLDTAADLCRTLPLVTAFLAYCAALLPACLRAAADLELATLLGHEELWHCVALLTTAALEAAFEAGGGSGPCSSWCSVPPPPRAINTTKAKQAMSGAEKVKHTIPIFSHSHHPFGGHVWAP